MRVFVFGDCHFGVSNYVQVEEAQEKLAEWVLENVKKYQCQCCIFVGDRFKKRDPEGYVRDLADREFRRVAKEVKLICICGNHDFYGKRGESGGGNSFGVLFEELGVKVVDRSEVIQLGSKLVGLVPWGGEVVKDVDIVFGHLEFEDVWWWSSSGVRVTDFSNVKMIVTGHVHRYAECRVGGCHVIHVGVPYERGFGDSSSVGGVVVDLDSMRVTQVPGYGMRFIDLRDVDVDEIDVDVVRGNVVKVTEVQFSRIGERLREVAVDVVVESDSRLSLKEIEEEIRMMAGKVDVINHEMLIEEWGKLQRLTSDEIEFGLEYFRQRRGR